MIPLWWEILKNAKLSGKAKGKSFDASKIKINLDKNDCKEKLRKLIWFNTTEPPSIKNVMFQSVGRAPESGSYALNTPEFNNLPEKTACNILQAMKSIDLNNIEDIELDRPGIVRFWDDRTKSKDIYIGTDCRVFLEVDKRDNVIRYFITGKQNDIAWIMFSFSDIKKWMAAL